MKEEITRGNPANPPGFPQKRTHTSTASSSSPGAVSHAAIQQKKGRPRAVVFPVPEHDGGRQGIANIGNRIRRNIEDKAFPISSIRDLPRFLYLKNPLYFGSSMVHLSDHPFR